MGLSTTHLALILGVLLVILMLLLVFIFLGVQAFSMGGTFGSLVNGVLPISAGLIVGKKKEASEDVEQKKADQAYKKAEGIFQI